MYTTKQVSSNEVSSRKAKWRPAWAVLVLLCVAQFMVTIDATVVNVALPSISRALTFGAGQVQWVVTAYLLCTGGLVLVAGRAADRFGRRRVLLAGLALFTAASLLSALAPDAGTLIGARAAQGVGAALMGPAALSIITATFTGSRRAAALSAWGAIAAGGFAAGLLIGGIVTTWLGWRWIFLINLPVGALVLVSVPLLIRRGPSAAVPLPILRALTLTAGLAALVYGLSAPHGWRSAPTVTALAGAALLVTGFGWLEAHAQHRVLPPLSWRTRSLPAGAVLMLAVTALFAGTLFVATFFIQQELHASALRTGLYYLPFAAAVGVAAHAAPHLLSRFGSRSVATAALLTVVAGAVLLAAPSHPSYAGTLLPAFVLFGLGAGFGLVSASVTALADVAPEHAGAASGLLTTGHEVGAALGVAVLSAIAAAAGHQVPAALRIPAGHHTAFTVVAVTAAISAVLTAALLPAVRPAEGTHHPIH
jgi:EmrB/QacA subfamily drug resistance transporter